MAAAECGSAIPRERDKHTPGLLSESIFSETSIASEANKIRAPVDHSGSTGGLSHGIADLTACTLTETLRIALAELRQCDDALSQGLTDGVVAARGGPEPDQPHLEGNAHLTDGFGVEGVAVEVRSDGHENPKRVPHPIARNSHQKRVHMDATGVPTLQGRDEGGAWIDLSTPIQDSLPMSVHPAATSRAFLRPPPWE